MDQLDIFSAIFSTDHNKSNTAKIIFPATQYRSLWTESYLCVTYENLIEKRW